MSFQHHQFEELTVLEAEAIGEPGQRRFRVNAGAPDHVIVLWMEKEQLQALGLAIEQLLQQIQDAKLIVAEIEPQAAPAVNGVPPTAPEFLISRMAIGFDDERKQVAIFAHDVEQDDDDEPVFSGRAPLAISKSLAEQISQVIAAGRPRCPRCGAPIGPEGHVCPHDNGHLPWNPA